MIKLLKGVGLLCIALFAAYFFLIDSIIKSQLEQEGSRALQAPLEIGEVDFHLISKSLTLRNVQVGNARLPMHNLLQADTVSVPLLLGDLLEHKFIVDHIDIHGLRFNRPSAEQKATASATPVSNPTRSVQLREALQRIQQTLNHPLASNTIDPNASIAGALLADEFKPVLDQIVGALNTVAMPASNASDWQILIHTMSIDGALDFGNSSLRFVGTIDNVSPQPQLFDAVAQFNFHNTEGEPVTMHMSGTLDKRKLPQGSLRFDLDGFPLSQWLLCDDPELKITIASANVNIQTLVSLTGNQIDLNTLAHFQQTHNEVANGGNEVARIIADVWRNTAAFDINIHASGDLQNLTLKLNSSLDAPLAAALQQVSSSQQLPPSSTFPQTSFPTSP
jgi:hypothetical protein